MNKYFFYILLTILFPTVLSAQKHPLSKSDSGIVFQNLEKYEYLLKQDDIRAATIALNSIAFIYWNNNHYEKAIEYYEKSLALNEKIANENGIAMINNNLGMLYSDIGEYNKSLKYFTKTLAARKANKEPLGIISAEINLSVVLNNVGRYQESLELLHNALDISRELQDFVQMRSVYGMLSETYEKNGNVDESLKYFNLYKTFHEEVQKQEMGKIRGELEEQKLKRQLAEAEKIKNENELLKTELLLFKKDELLEEKDSLNKTLFDSLSRSQLERALLAKQEELLAMEIKRSEAEREILAKEKSYFVTISLVTFLTAAVILSLVLAYIFKSRQHMISMRKKNETIALQSNELEKANEELHYKNKELSKSIAELNLMKDKLVLSEKMASIGAFTAGIAHEINNSMNYIAGSSMLLCSLMEEYSEEIKNRSADDLEHAFSLKENIKTGIERTNLIIKKLRTHETDDASFERLTIKQVVHEVNQMLEPKAFTKNIKLVFAIDEKLEADVLKEKLHLMFYNIIDNAIDASFENSTVRIFVTTDDKKLIHISIQDSGIGIPQENMGKIYDPFFTTKDIGDGLGLGLYMVFSYVKAHKGTIEVSSKEGEGTTFEIQIPQEQKVEKKNYIFV